MTQKKFTMYPSDCQDNSYRGDSNIKLVIIANDWFEAEAKANTSIRGYESSKICFFKLVSIEELEVKDEQ